VIPEGMRDVLPGEGAELHAVEELLRGRFAAYGYDEVGTPTLEFAETLERVDDDTLGGGYRLFDDQGRELMLRTDMTVPVARLAAARLRDRPLPLRLSYVARSFRPWAPQRGQDGEFLQAGVELIGLPSAAADAECVALLCDALGASGLPSFKVTLGTTRFAEALVASLGLEQDDRESLLEAMTDRDYPLLESIVAKAGVGDDARRALQRTLELGGTTDSLAQARRLASTDDMEAALEHLVEVRELVEEAGFEDVVTYDLGLFPELDYYTGVIFEAWAPGAGMPLATGGRYDELLAAFDWDQPAVGFAIAVDRFASALEDAGRLPAPPPGPLAFVGGLDEPRRVAELREAGVAVAPLPADARPPHAGPALVRRDGRYVLEDGERRAEGSWRDVLKALGIQ
jgi:ATP phosphoribosyltransferase regulatory subunit